MRTRSFLLASALLAAALPAAAGRKLAVVATTTDLAALARAVGGDRVDVSSIASGSQDPHFIEARPSYMVAARNADLFIDVGMELEVGWEPLILQGSRNDRIQPGQPGHLDASESVVKLEVPTGQVDRSQGDVHPFGNPHYWLDPWNARQVAGAIAERLKQLDPDGAAAYDAGLAAFRKQLDDAMFGAPLVDALGGDAAWQMSLAGSLPAALEAERARRGGSLPALGGWAGKLAPYAGTKVITYHESWPYFLARFGFASIGEIEPKPGIPPTPSHLLELIKAASAQGAKCILVEPWYGTEAPALVASKTGARVVRLAQSVGGDGTGDYLALMDRIVDSVAAALSGARTQG